MRILHGVNQKRQERMLFNYICQSNYVNPQQVKEDIKNQGFENLTIKVMTTLMNPEDYFNDLVEDGYSVHDALVAIMEGELVQAKLERMFPDGYMEECMEDLGNGLYEVTLEDDDDDELELITSDEDMAYA